MALPKGSRLGPYEIVSALGAGGMGEVYRARDTQLARDVAIKILPAEFATDAERIARLQREARTLAALSHPGIAVIHGLEQAGDVQAIVMELVPGDDLSARIVRGPIPLDQALPIAAQIVEALQAAHEQGIIHRDLKPANIKIRPDGSVKVLDFGLAKELAPAPGSAAAVRQSESPTITSPAMMTSAGVILGTAAYMSPEQAKGDAADKRADVWAFGCVLFEMLTGTRAFAGEDVSDTLAAVLRGRPDWNALPKEVSQPIRTLVQRCLERDRRARIADIAVVKYVLAEGVRTASEPETERRHSAWRRALPWAAAGALGSGLALMILFWAQQGTVGPPLPLRVSADLGTHASLLTDPGAATAISPDGDVIAFAGVPTGGAKSHIYVRRLAQLQATPLSNSDGGISPFFSPDGQWIAFFAGGKLKKIPVTGGTASTLCDSTGARGGSWGEDGTIAFAQSGREVGILRVLSSGSTPESMTTLENGETTHRWPQMLPGATAVLFTGHTRGTGFDDAHLVVQALPSGTRKIVWRGGYFGRYLRSGHLVFVREGTLFAVPFDLDRLEVIGQPVPVLEGVAALARSGGAEVAASDNGTLVYVPELQANLMVPIHWMDRERKTTPLLTTPWNWSNLRFAPNGLQLAMDVFDGKQRDVWIYDWARDLPARLTFDAAEDWAAVWTPDSRRVTFASRRGGGNSNIYWQRADGTGDVQRLTESTLTQFPTSWDPDSKFLLFEERARDNQSDLMILPMDGDERSGWKPGTPRSFLNSPHSERNAAISPDGQWVAYTSNETSRVEVWVRPFLGSGGQRPISTDGGADPKWTKTELFYSAQDRPGANLALRRTRIMAVPYSVKQGSLEIGKPQLVSDVGLSTRYRGFAVHPDGQRFALAVTPETPTEILPEKVVFILNFFDELRRIAPVTR